MKFSFFNWLKKLGPGLLFAGAAIGVSHLVQSTRAGADFGFGLIWALILIHLIKYPFFQFGPRYATATGESLLDGYKRLGKGVLAAYFVLNLATMFTIQAAVTVVTAGLAANLFGITTNPIIWSIIITVICFLLLIIGRYKLLDHLMKFIIVILSISTITAFALAVINSNTSYNFDQIIPEGSIEVAFLIAFLGWMPAPLDVSVWQSLWAIEKQKDKNSKFDTKQSIFDFNIGYISTLILGVFFVSLGAIVMFNSGETFSNSAFKFSEQLINLYTSSLGAKASVFIAVAAFTTMFSTTLTTLDASPRAMTKTFDLLTDKSYKNSYWFWISFLAIGTISILLFFMSEMGLLIKIATILSFLTAPFFAIINFKLISGKHTPKEHRPSNGLKLLSWIGILFLIGFSIWYLISL
ncbi:Mn2+ and Fe2+ transporters of the NRAMP family [Lutibacter agarilyticus]|uniref:Mn2+ and Fe2+ transporters of the NRAMP family n=1 Tax=Lutibacter agarilyticus TaxID=1109740 RepID=A0A238WVC8_9FLAO|nr:divalent metal cation transporter [Lutibacter agarilyticus]SNR50331.1 Mn2+ and Fe2+ transporters of the NRAMP family [Lutibacter agarilyticus]